MFEKFTEPTREDDAAVLRCEVFYSVAIERDVLGA